MSDPFDQWWTAAAVDGLADAKGSREYERIKALWRKCSDRVVLPGWLVAMANAAPGALEEDMARIDRAALPDTVCNRPLRVAAIARDGEGNRRLLGAGDTDSFNLFNGAGLTDPYVPCWVYARAPDGTWELIGHHGPVVDELIEGFDVFE